MTYYAQQVLKIRELLFQNDYLYDRLLRAKAYMDIHYTKSICLNEITEEAFLSKFHFIRQFKMIYGCTPYQYLTTVRIEKAKELLQADLTIKQVCHSIGFNSLGSFTSLFKKTAGLTPAAFQRQSTKPVPPNRIPHELFLGLRMTKKSNFKENI